MNHVSFKPLAVAVTLASRRAIQIDDSEQYCTREPMLMQYQNHQDAGAIMLATNGSYHDEH